MSVMEDFAQLRTRLAAGVVGQAALVESLLIALLSDGHVLLEGAPGLAKTRIAKALANSFEGAFSRIQFTPDLLPSDLTGGAIYNPAEHRFDFQQGPLFGNFILADEINRAPAKVQSALLEAMEERQITAGDRTHPLADPFFVVATQNPIEHEGTWELPQAQLDRFLLHVVVDYPSPETEREILDLVMRETVEAQGNASSTEPVARLTAAQLGAARSEALDVHVSPLIRDFIVRIISGTRNDPEAIPGVGEHLSHPISPRGSIGLARTAQVRAWLEGRDHVVPEDVILMAPEALRHRMGLTYRAEADGVHAGQIVETLLERVDAV
ncbi:MAG: MoxR family ATPase [Pseudomonadota bacterium]